MLSTVKYPKINNRIIPCHFPSIAHANSIQLTSEGATKAKDKSSALTSLDTINTSNSLRHTNNAKKKR
jgi:hypothetical protein